MHLLPVLYIVLTQLARARLLHQREGTSAKQIAQPDAQPDAFDSKNLTDINSRRLDAFDGTNVTVFSRQRFPLQHSLDASLANDKDFPSIIHPNRKLIGKLKYFMQGFHVDDVGIYLSLESEMWGRDVTFEEFLDGALGHCTIRYRIVSPWLTRNSWKKGIINVGYKKQAKLSRCPDMTQELTEMKKLIDDGPNLKVGMVLDFPMEKDGMAYFVEGKFVNKRGTGCSCKSSLRSFVGEEPISTNFKTALFTATRTGRATLVIAKDGHLGIIWGLAAALIVVVLVCISITCYCFWCRGPSNQSAK